MIFNILKKLSQIKFCTNMTNKLLSNNVHKLLVTHDEVLLAHSLIPVAHRISTTYALQSHIMLIVFGSYKGSL